MIFAQPPVSFWRSRCADLRGSIGTVGRRRPADALTGGAFSAEHTLRLRISLGLGAAWKRSHALGL
jgi:hypothetical protein